MARNLCEFWENLKAGKDCITEIPKDRWDYRLFYDPDKKEGKIYSKWGGFIEDFDKFDARFFNMTPREAELTDPQERLFLETVWHTLEDSGYKKSDLWGHRVGVFVGIMWGEYQLFGPEALFMGYPRLPGSSYASIANRISYFFNFMGPSMALDTMCSSSLTAIHLACQSIRLGESEMAVAGGVNVSIHPQKYLQLSQGRFASSEGRCRSFGRGGDGYVPAEGVGAVLLKSLPAAVAAGDHIYGVIRGSAVNHGGKTNGYTVPNPNAQAAVISDALRRTDTDPETISYLEAHGTGTSLGDPIEITGLVKAFGNHRQKKQYCAIGSVKSNIGHAESAAGMAALSKVLLQLKHKQLVPSIHSETLNPNIRFNDSPFYVQRELTEWKSPEIEINGEKKILPRRAGISSFGAGGSNAHLIVEEYGEEVRGSGFGVRGDLLPQTSHPGPYLVVLSAGNEKQLIAYTEEMMKFLETGDSLLLPEPVLQKDSLIRDIVKLISEAASVSETEIDPDESFQEYGLDAVDLGTLAEKVSEISHTEISAATVSDHPSAQALAHFLTEKTQSSSRVGETHLSLADMAFTLQVGREPMAERIAVVISDTDELRDKLSRFIRGEEDVENLFRGNAGDRGNLLVKGRAGQAFVSILIQDGELDRLGQLWVSGADIDWKLIYPDETPRRIPLPLYPFAKERHWITDSLAALLKDQQKQGAVSTGPSLLSFDSRPVPRIESKKELSHSSESMTDYLIRAISDITKLDPKDVDPAEDFEVLGLDSVMIAQLNAELELRFGKLPSTLFFKYKNLKSLAAYLLENHKEEGPGSEARGSGDEAGATFMPMSYRSETDDRVHTERCEDIAVIGLSGVYPLAENIEAFWENLKAGRDCISEIPRDRWDYQSYPGMYCKWGGFISDADKFDPSFFNISPNTARFMDPQERLFLQTAWACIEDAGYTKDRLADLQSGDRRGRVGVFAGVTFNDYQLYSAAEWSKGNIIPLNSQIFSVANRVSYHLNLGGPSLSVDTACSSSLYAIHLACESIRRKECTMAVAGGVNLSTHPAKYVTLCMSRFAASDGRCRAFGEGGDGYVPGEGVGAVFLKPMSQAVADRDHIYAVIKGTAVNHDGKTQGYTVPNPVAQSEAIRTALVRSGINPRTVSYVEAHGTGTSLGDPIEITGLSDVYNDYSKDRQYCAIGSVKSNIGHPEAAAGIAQITKVLLQMKHQTLVPSLLHSERMNPNIDFGNCPFYVQQCAEPWKQPVVGNQICPRRAGVSSFGAGGVNVHIVLEEYETKNEQKPDSQTKATIIPLSAKSENNLREYTARLKNFVETHGRASLLEDIAYTLQTGRESMPFRAAFAVKSPDELLEKLEGYLGNGKSAEGIFQGKADKKFRSDAEQDTAHLKELFQKGMTDKIAELWTQGAEIDWETVCVNGSKPRRISLPTYPFSKERYWVFGSEEPAVLPEKVKDREVSSENRLSVAVPKKEEALLTSHFSLPTSGTASGFLAELADAPEDEQHEMLAEYFQNKIGKLLGFAPPNLPAKDQGFFEMGMESIQAMQLHSDIGEAFAVTLPDTALFDYPNIRELSAYLLTQIRFDKLEIPDTKVDTDWNANVSAEELEYLIWDTLPADIEAMSIDAVERMLEAEMN